MKPKLIDVKVYATDFVRHTIKGDPLADQLWRAVITNEFDQIVKTFSGWDRGTVEYEAEKHYCYHHKLGRRIG